MKTFACIVALLLVPVASAAQSIPDLIRCATGGAHQPGCTLSDPTCRYQDFLMATCSKTPGDVVTGPVVPPPTTEPTPTPTPDPQPVVDLNAPTNLRSGVNFDHPGADWFTLRIDGAYHDHVGGWTRYIPLDEATLPAGATYSVTVDACTDLSGCVRSAPLLIVR